MSLRHRSSERKETPLTLWCKLNDASSQINNDSVNHTYVRQPVITCSVFVRQLLTSASGRGTCTRRRFWRWWCSSWWSRVLYPCCSCAPSSSPSPCIPDWEASSWTSCHASSSSRSAPNSRQIFMVFPDIDRFILSFGKYWISNICQYDPTGLEVS